MIDPSERHLYREAEQTQWDEHVRYGAVRALSVDESRRLREEIDPARILRSRFAYKDKNFSKRRVDGALGPKPKARLCVSGQNDPDLTKDIVVDAPTTSRASIMMAIQLALAKQWVASIGDIRAAFLNGVPAPRSLYFEQPKRGIPSLEKGQLVEILKGVFGLSTSPKLWWMKLSNDLKNMELEHEGQKYYVSQNTIDPCVFVLMEKESQEVVGLILTHVDDLLLLTQQKLREPLQQKLASMFPVDGWQNDKFECAGCEYDFTSPECATISQTSYAVVLGYRDAAWGNVADPNAEPGDEK